MSPYTDSLSDAEYATFMLYCTDFFIDNNRLLHKDSHGAHKLVISSGQRLDIIRTTHDSLGHKAFYATKAHISQHFWWPSMVSDVHWYTKTCHICQLCQTVTTSEVVANRFLVEVQPMKDNMKIGEDF
jgi:hypothetical protein